MSIAEIKNAIDALDQRERALSTAELFAIEAEPNAADLEMALQRGMHDVTAGRVKEVEEVKKLIPGWTSKS